MDRPSFSPDPGGGGGTVVLTPKQARKYFEFFRVGCEREVLLLGDLVEQHVHYVRSKNHKVLCGARLGGCPLCEKAGESDDVSDQQVEYYAASYIRSLKDREFRQRVAVFTATTGEQVLRLVPEGSLRGHRFEVRRPSTQKFKVAVQAGPPRGLANVVPAAFDLLPFVRARFGRRQEADRPLVFLPALLCKDVISGPVGRPRPLDLSADDCLTPADQQKLRSKLAQWRGESVGDVAEPTPVPVDSPAPVNTPTEPVTSREAGTPTATPVKGQAAANEPGLGTMHDATDAITKRLLFRGEAQYAPRKVVRPGITDEDDEAALTKGAAEIVCGDVAAHRNGRAPKGGAQ